MGSQAGKQVPPCLVGKTSVLCRFDLRMGLSQDVVYRIAQSMAISYDP